MLRSALIAGATGLVGRHCLERLLHDNDYQQVVAITRRSLASPHPRLLELRTEFAELQDVTCPIRIDDAFCALGTTIKNAGSQAEFARVDFDYVAAFARYALVHGAQNFVLISALGADPDSRSFYARTKGRAEAEITALGFDCLHILRPSLLTGERSESRPAERLGLAVGRLLSPLMAGPMRRLRPVHADRVAQDMVACAKKPNPGVHFHYPEN